jgi:hypothetical protein
MDPREKLINWILRVTVIVLASIMVAVIGVLLIGIFLPNEQIDNKDILALIGPAFNTVIGAFVGLLGGLSVNGPQRDASLPQIPTPAPTPIVEPEPEPEPEAEPKPQFLDESQ